MEQRCDFHWRTSGHQLAKGATATPGKRIRRVGFFVLTGVEWSPEELDGSARARRSRSPAGPLLNSISTSPNEGNDAFKLGPKAWSISIMILFLLLLLCLKICFQTSTFCRDFLWIFAEVHLTVMIEISIFNHF